MTRKGGTSCGESVTLEYTAVFTSDVQLRCDSVSPDNTTLYSDIKNVTVSSSYGKDVALYPPIMPHCIPI